MYQTEADTETETSQNDIMLSIENQMGWSPPVCLLVTTLLGGNKVRTYTQTDQAASLIMHRWVGVCILGGHPWAVSRIVTFVYISLLQLCTQ